MNTATFPLLAAIPQPDLRSLVLVLAASSSAALLARASRRIVLPTLVLEIALGALIGPKALGWATVDPYSQFLADLGLVLLFFYTGIEVVEKHVPRRALVRGSSGWVLSLALGIAGGYLLHFAGLDAEGWLTGVALSTTAVGVLVPILADAGLLPTRLGVAVLGTGVAGEFWPIVLISVFLTGVYGAATEVILLCVFGAVTFVVALAALQARPPRIVEILRETLDSTGQAAVRLSILLLAALVLLARDVGFDFILGAFAAGLIVGLVVDTPEGRSVRTRLEGIGYGFLIPVYFVVTGLTFDLDSLLTLRGAGLALLFLALMLAFRGAAALLWLREIGRRETVQLALCAATGLPLIVAIVSIGARRGAIGPTEGASLIAAGMISVLVFPLTALAVDRSASERNLERVRTSDETADD
jgi:Kef-type K+ transport system membrane component KefB